MTTPEARQAAEAMREEAAQIVDSMARGWNFQSLYNLGDAARRAAAAIRALPLPTPAAGGRCGYFIEQDETCKLPYPHPGQEHNSRPTPAAGERAAAEQRVRALEAALRVIAEGHPWPDAMRVARAALAPPAEGG